MGGWVVTWKMKRVNQCAKCPWRVDVDPHDIPNAYSEVLHHALAVTIAEPGSIRSSGRAMACHEHDTDDQVHCVGWVMHQVGRGNNIPLRLRMMSCENFGKIKLFGAQHSTFENTLP